MDTENSQTIDINATSSMMRARSHQYPDNEKEYVDTTYFDEENESFDLGFQRLKQLDPKLYPEFAYLKKIFVDHNNLSALPDSKYLPNLEQLTCSANNLTSIPFYPKLTFLNISRNKIVGCSQYHNSQIAYFDCSYNLGFVSNFGLPHCQQLYTNDCELKAISLDLFPRLRYLDCGNNKLTKITGGENLVEINIQNNQISEIPVFPRLVRLMADNNLIEVLPTQPNLSSATISYNRLVEIRDQPSLKKIIANNNLIKILGKMPELELVDFSHNCLEDFDIPPKIKYISLQFNPFHKIVLGPGTLTNIQELQVNFETYNHIYQTYYQHFHAVNIQTNPEKLEQILQKLDKVFDDKLTRYVYKHFNSIKFRNREEALFRITLKLYWHFFSDKKAISTMEELVSTNEFQYLLENMTKIYHKTIVITLYFNDFLN